MYKYYLTYNGTTTECEEEPIGWDSFESILKRNDKYHGISAEYSDLDIKFWDITSKSIIDSAYNTSIDEEVIFTVENDGVEEYRGVLDLGEYSKVNDKYEYIKVKVGDIGIQTTFNNRIDQKVDLNSETTMDGDPITLFSQNLNRPIKLPCVPLRLESSLTNNNEFNLKGDISDEFRNVGIRYYSFPFDVDGSVNSELCPTVSPEEYNYPNSDTPYIFSIDKVDDIVSKTGLIKLNSKFKIDVSHQVVNGIHDLAPFYNSLPSSAVDLLTYRLVIYRKRINQANVDLYDSGELYPLSYSKNLWNEVINGINYQRMTVNLLGELNLNATFNYDYEVEDTVHCTFSFWIKSNLTYQVPGFGVSAGLKVSIGNKSKVAIQGLSIYPDSTAKVGMVHDVLSRIAKNISGAYVRSSFYSRPDSDINSTTAYGKGSLKAIVSGLRLRNVLPTYGQNIMSISFLDMMKGLAPIDNVGWGWLGNQLYVEDWSFFYNNTIVMTINDPVYLERKANNAALFSRVKCGYEKFETDGINGLDTFCSEREYSSTLKTADNKLEIISKFIADSYAIEKTRRMQGQKATTDSPYDEDIFIICLRKNSQGYSVDQGCNATFADYSTNPYGDYIPTLISQNKVYNARISPVRNLKRWSNSILMYKRTDDFIRFSSGSGNYNARIAVLVDNGFTYNYDYQNSNIVRENDDVNCTNILMSEIIQVNNQPLSLAQFNTIKANPYGTVMVNGIATHIKELRYKRKTGIANFTLIPRNQ